MSSLQIFAAMIAAVFLSFGLAVVSMMIETRKTRTPGKTTFSGLLFFAVLSLSISAIFGYIAYYG